VEQILTTKLYIPPTRPKLVPRPRLIEQLNEGLHRKLTLISAPAGYGKTTLVSEWVNKIQSSPPKESQIKSRISWLSLDEGDNDPGRFLTYFIAALGRVEGIAASIGKEALGMLQSPQPQPTESVLTSLINEVAALPDSIIVILDDYHHIDSPAVDETLDFLLKCLPPQLHLIIATRIDPQLPLARLRARSQLTELRAIDLRFTASEAAEFLNRVMGLNLPAADISALDIRTEGWIAGLQLAAISMRGNKDATTFVKSFTGSHRFVLDYLIEEVLEQQSETIQTFLLQTSILNRLTGSLCDKLTSKSNGQATLETLERANLFIIPLDGERRWYRYHQLFSDLLRQRLHQTQSEQIPILHQQASEWYEQNGFVDEAIEHALRAEDFGRAAYLIEDQFGVMYDRGEQTKLRHWLAELPEELVFSKPHLCIVQAWNLFTSGQLDAAEQFLQVAEMVLGPGINRTSVSPLEQGELPEAERMRLVGKAAAIRAFLASYRGDVMATIQYAHQALEYLPQEELPWRSAASIALGDAFVSQGEMVAAHEARSEALVTSKATGDAYILMIANLRLAETLRQQGKLEQVIDICEQQMQFTNENGLSQAVVAGWLLAIWGEVLAELDDLDRAIKLAVKGVELVERGRDVAMVGWSNLCLIRILFSRGDFARAEDVIHKMEHIAQEYDLPLRVLVQLSAWQARIWLEKGKLEAATRWMGERGLEADGEHTPAHEMEYIVLARILIAQGQLDEATRLLERLLEAAEAGGRISSVIEILILQALAFQAGGDTARAMIILERALMLAEKGGFIRTFVDEGLPIEKLLNRINAKSERMEAYLRKLLAAFRETKFHPFDFAQTKPSVIITQPLIEPLSERELEVLQYIAEGFTNQEIAARLYLSLNTVKVHTRNIYGKLGVNNRTHAVAKARDLEILIPT
jgi:LuxR family maltose regulon positive regulatory protein